MRSIHVMVVFLSYAASLCSAASITGVTNAASNLPPGMPNSGISQGAIFAVYGAGLGPAALQQAQSFPLPTTQGLAGTTITVTVNGVTKTCIMLYTSAGQVAAVLPSATPVGNGTLTVTYQGASASIAIQVAAAGFGTITLNSAGTGPAVVTDAFYNPITMVNPAYPGQTLILWGSGLGAVTGDETQPPQEVDLGTGVQVFVENQPAQVLYGGRSGYPGLDQINFTVPAGISGGCRTSIAVLEQGVTGNVTTMAVAPAGQSTCSEVAGALTAANLQNAVATGTANAASVFFYHFSASTDSDTVAAEFTSYPIGSLIRSYGGSFGPSIGSCNAYETLGTNVLSDPIQPTLLDAGPSLTLTGPQGSKTAAEIGTGTYGAVLGARSSFIVPGSYTVSNGGGGANVAGFSWNLTLPAPISFTNLPATINRAQDLTLTWSNSAAFQAVSILGVSGVPLSSGKTAYLQFYCTAAALAGQFTIPAAILNLIPTNGFGATGAPGIAMEIAGVATADFTAAGSPGISAGVFSAFAYSGSVAKVQ